MARLVWPADTRQPHDLWQGAPEVAGQVLLDLLHAGGLLGGAQQAVHAHHEARGAEAALAAVRLGQALLHRVQALARVADACAPFDGVPGRAAAREGVAAATQPRIEQGAAVLLSLQAHHFRQDGQRSTSVPRLLPSPARAAQAHLRR